MTPQAKVWSHEGNMFCCILNHGQNLRFHLFIQEHGIIMGTGSILACRWHCDRIRLVSLTLCAAAGRQILYSVHDAFRIRFTLITLSESIFEPIWGRAPPGPLHRNSEVGVRPSSEGSYRGIQTRDLT